MMKHTCLTGLLLDLGSKFILALSLIALTTAPALAQTLEDRVAALEALLTPVTALTVNCPDKIQDAVDQATPGTPLTITGTGTCTEQVLITADDVTVQGSGGAELVGGFSIQGAHRVLIGNMTIKNGTISYPVGVFAARGASVDLRDLIISGQGGTGIFLSRNAYADIRRVDVTNPSVGDNALGLSDGAVTRVRNSTFRSDNGDPGNGAALGLFRSSSARFDRDNLFENTVVGGLAIQILHTSNLRVQNGANFVIGNLRIGNNSAAHLRGGVDVTGNINLGGDSSMILQGASTVTGSVQINDQSLLSTFSLPGTVIIGGGVTCNGGAAGGVVNSSAISGAIDINCTLFP